MSTQVQYRRGTAVQNDAFTGALAEITVDTTNWTLRVHDGVTPGGVPTVSANSPYAIQTGNVLPQANLTYNLGSPTQMWNSLYVSGNTIYLGNLQLKEASSNTFAVFTSDGVTQANLDVGNIDVSALSQGTSTVGISGTNGNAYISVGGTSNVAVFATTGAYITGLASVSGNITGGNLNTAGSISATGNISGGNLITGGDISGANVISATTLSATANVTGGNVLTGGLISATGNITSAANVSGNYLLGNAYYVTGLSPTQIYNGTSNVAIASSGGNIRVNVGGTSNVVVWATTGEYVTGVISATGNITGGNLSGTNIIGTLTTAAQTNITSVGTLGSLAVTGNITGGNLITGGGSGGNITGANVISATTVSATANVIGGNLSAGTGEITVGGLTLSGNTIVSTGPTLTIDPNLSGGSDGAVIIAGNLSVTGNVTYFNSNVVTVNDKFINLANNAATAPEANGSGIGVGPLDAEYASITYNSTANIWVLTNGANVSGAINATGNITGGNLSGTNITGTLTTASQTNITSVGTLGALAVTGNITSGNLQGTSIVGTLTTAAQTNITSVGTLGALAVTGNITSGNFIGTLNGSGANVTSISATNISSGTLAQARLANAAVTLGSTALTLGATVTTIAGLSSVTSTTFVGALTGAATTAGTVTTAAQGNITSVGTLTSLAVSGAITVNSGSAATAIVNGGSTGVGNIGSSTTTFNTVFAKATTAQYADLAEMYAADADYAPGTVLEFGGTNEVTLSVNAGSTRIAGVVSTDPAHVMNAALKSKHPVALALTGRVPTSVIGTVRKGDMMVAGGSGTAVACATPTVGTIIGKALEDFDGESGTIEIVVGRV